MPIKNPTRVHQNCPTCACVEPPSLPDRERDLAEIKYKIVMRLAERWAMQALQTQTDPRELCAKRFRDHSTYRREGWSDVTKVILTAFVIREHQVLTGFLYEQYGE